MPVRRHCSGALAALIDTAAAAGFGTVGAAGSTPRAARGAAPPEANPGPRQWCAAIALLPLIACACVGNNAAAVPPVSSAPAVARPPASHPARVHQSQRYQRPPQFVMISFDGSGDPVLWKHWRAVGRRTGARFSFFLSGVYLLDRAHARAYHPPRHRPGSSDIGFSDSPADVRALVRQIDLGYGEGHELGTHYNG